MAEQAGSLVEVREVADGLWLWRLEHPHWGPGQGWDRIVTCTCVESQGEVVVLDPLAPTAGASSVWRRLDACPPTAIIILRPDHLRDIDVFVRRYRARAFGPRLNGSIQFRVRLRFGRPAAALHPTAVSN
jgi:hypothetical protein